MSKVTPLRMTIVDIDHSSSEFRKLQLTLISIDNQVFLFTFRNIQGVWKIPEDFVKYSFWWNIDIEVIFLITIESFKPYFI